MEETIPEVRVSVPANGVADEKPAASPPASPLWWRALSFLALRVADTVFYSMCAAMCLVSVGSAVGLLGLRIISGSGGTMAAEVGGSVTFAGQCLLPVGLVAVPLYVFFSVSSDKESAPRRESERSKLGAVRAFLLSDPAMQTQLWYLLAGVGCLTEFLSHGKGSLFWEKAGSLLFCGGAVGVAVMHCCFICPLWIRQWRSGQRNRVNKKN